MKSETTSVVWLEQPFCRDLAGTVILRGPAANFHSVVWPEMQPSGIGSDNAPTVEGVYWAEPF